MYRLIIMCGLVLMLMLTTNANADDDDWQEICQGWGTLAEAVMDGRQAGVSMQDMIDAVITEDTDSLILDLVIEAYESPRYSVPENQRREIQDFKNKWYLGCVKVFQAVRRTE